MTPVPTNKQKAEALAAERGAQALAAVDMKARCTLLILDPPAADGSVTVRVLGQDLRLVPPDFSATNVSSGKPAKAADRILAIHYLQHSSPIKPAGEWISFRDFPGGQFYWNPFVSRSIKPLVARIGNNLELLKSNLTRFQCSTLEMPDLSVRIQAVGAIDAALIYRLGDEELEPSAEILFDASAKRVFCAEDIAVIAGRICIGLL